MDAGRSLVKYRVVCANRVPFVLLTFPRLLKPRIPRNAELRLLMYVIAFASLFPSEEQAQDAQNGEWRIGDALLVLDALSFTRVP